MLSRQQRYPLRQDTTFFQTSQKHIVGFLVVYLKKIEGPALGGVIVSKKTAAKSTVRNLWKRKLKALLSPILNESKNTAVILMPRFIPKEDLIDQTISQKIKALIQTKV
jgi:ribonuclease P protein component